MPTEEVFLTNVSDCFAPAEDIEPGIQKMVLKTKQLYPEPEEHRQFEARLNEFLKIDNASKIMHYDDGLLTSVDGLTITRETWQADAVTAMFKCGPLGGYKIQGKDPASAEKLAAQALELERIGCFALVLECVPAGLAERITGLLKIPVIGIGAGPSTDGQVLVLHDMLGINIDFSPRFLRRYHNLHEEITGAVTAYIEDVKARRFPNEKEQY